ncbi:MAG TPA: carboxypeptidase-like regulatory domain-containing protein, partial [Candidatus Solibacter sp.]|nr:carboxypeptidase-like regulatory domain-containing protein [Candidatus Solibacter sp.]
MTGIVVNAAGKQVATFRTEHEGRGRFAFVPVKGEAYSIRVTEPAGIKTTFHLPAVKESGVVISSLSDVTPRQKDVAVRVAATAAGNYGIALSRHEKEIAFKSIALGANQTSNVAFTVPRSLDGVIVATVYDNHKMPMAERLLFREPEHKLKVRITADHSDYVPGDKVSLRVSTTDETGRPVAAVVGLTATDSSVLEMIDKREQAPRLPVMVLLESEVKDLADTHVYLDETNPKAPLATDLLLGTQGWRRFAFTGQGSLSGNVRDFSGTFKPGVSVEARNRVTGMVITATTNEAGAYMFPMLKSGTYQVSASLPGFETQVVTGLKLVNNTPVRQDFRLTVPVVTKDDVMFAVAAAGRGGAVPGPVRAQAVASPPPMAAPGAAVLAGVLGGVLREPLGEIVADKLEPQVLALQVLAADRVINPKPV